MIPLVQVHTRPDDCTRWCLEAGFILSMEVSCFIFGGGGAKLFHSGHTPTSYSCPSAAHSFTSTQSIRTVVSAIPLAGLLRLKFQLAPYRAVDCQ